MGWGLRMPLLEMVERFLKQVNERLKPPIAEEDILSYKVNFYPWKHSCVVHDPDLYHRIAQAFGVKDLNSYGNLFFHLDVKRDNGMPDHWTVSIAADDERNSFLEKYGSCYKIE